MTRGRRELAICAAVAERASTQLVTADRVLSQRLAHLGGVFGKPPTASAAEALPAARYRRQW